MQPLVHALNIGTLATWLSVAGFGGVGMLVVKPVAVPTPVKVSDSIWVDQDFTLGEPAAPTAEAPPPPAAAEPVDPPEVLPAPPAMPELAALEPLPDLPTPIPPVSPAVGAAAEPSAPAVARPSPARPTGRRSSAVHAAPRGNAANAEGAAGGGVVSATARLAAGQMPAPAYPAEARRQGQTGTLVVEFTIDTAGRVIAAYATSPSPWPLLNQEAIRTVRRWKFPPGPVMKLQRPIVFQLR